MHDIWFQWGKYWLHGEACNFFHFSLLCSQFAGSWAENRILRFSMRSRSPETTTIIKVGSVFVLEASSAFCTQNFLKGSAGSQKDRKWKCYADPCFPQGKILAPLKLDFFKGTDVSKLQHSFISFSVMWNATIPAKVLRNAMTHIKIVNYAAERVQTQFSLQKHSTIFYMKNYYKSMCQKSSPVWTWGPMTLVD